MNTMIQPSRLRRFGAIFPQGTLARAALGAALVLGAGVAIVGPGRLIAQIEGERGIAPVVATGDIEVGGIEVEASGKTALDARSTAWRDAYKKAWEKLHGPALDVGSIEGLVAGVEVESESIGPHRYRARLTVVFDRARTGAMVTGDGSFLHRSEPMLVIPVLYSAGVGQVYEVRGPWQRVWAEFHTGASALDYVRPSGAGGDSLLITAGQPGRRSRVWWRGILDGYGASNVLMPEARLERQWPGGPVVGTFTARYGADNHFLGGFTLNAADEAAVPAMLGQALARMDQLYTDALHRGLLRPEGTLSIANPAIDPGLQTLIDAGRAAAAAQAAADARAAAAQAAADAETAPVTVAEPVAPKVEAKPAAQIVIVQFASPDARAVDALQGVRGAPGVEQASTSSLAIGGTSVMRVSYNGGAAELGAWLRAHGWQVQAIGNGLRIRR